MIKAMIPLPVTEKAVEAFYCECGCKPIVGIDVMYATIRDNFLIPAGIRYPGLSVRQEGDREGIQGQMETFSDGF